MARKITREIKLGPLVLGNGQPVLVQTMTNTDTRDAGATLAQIRSVAALGAEIVRLAVIDDRAADVLGEIVKDSPVPLVADIHFDWRLAVKAARAGVGGLRVNPGNLGGPDKLRKVAEAAGQSGAAIRIGVNSGSLEKEILARHRRPTAAAMVESALGQVKLLEECGFINLKVSLKASDAASTIVAVRLWAETSDYPQHLGVTEAGDILSGVVKSSYALGNLLADGLGDTIRVSLTAPPEDEVKTAWEILRAVGLRKRGVEIISCPTCGRCEIDLIGLAAEVKKRLADIEKPLKVAVMGCVVNGPGEAKEADFGVAGGRGQGLLFIKGRPGRKIAYENLANALEEEVRKVL